MAGQAEANTETGSLSVSLGVSLSLLRRSSLSWPLTNWIGKVAVLVLGNPRAQPPFWLLEANEASDDTNSHHNGQWRIHLVRLRSAGS